MSVTSGNPFIRITVVRKADYPDLQEKYELPQDCPCPVREGAVFETDGYMKPEGLCDSAWETLSPFAARLVQGRTDMFPGWMKDPHSLMLSCNDGFRPVTFLLETRTANEKEKQP